MNNNTTLGWDLGGAHLKAVLLDSAGVAIRAIQLPCPLWRGMEYLERTIDEVMAQINQPVMCHAVTMSGELADIFSCRDEGVQRLVTAMSERVGSEKLRIYAGRQGLVAPQQAGDYLAEIASANWHASAAMLAGRVENGLFIDIGSTTADLVALQMGRPAALGFSDAERMRHEELVYTGVVRTPVMAVTTQVPFAGEWQRLAAEHFATMADVYRIVGDLPEDCDMSETADGAGKSPADSARRLARMVGCDLAAADFSRWQQLARTIKNRQLRTLQDAAERILSRGLLPDSAPIVGAGAGRFLVRELARSMGREYQDVTDWVSATDSAREWAVVCLPAYAVASLAAQR